MPGPASAWDWMADHPSTGKPPHRRTRHTGLLSLSHPSMGRRIEVPRKSWGMKEAHRVIH